MAVQPFTFDRERVDYIEILCTVKYQLISHVKKSFYH